MSDDRFTIETEFNQIITVEANDCEVCISIAGRCGSRIAYMPNSDAAILANAIIEMVKRNDKPGTELEKGDDCGEGSDDE